MFINCTRNSFSTITFKVRIYKKKPSTSNEENFEFARIGNDIAAKKWMNLNIPQYDKGMTLGKIANYANVDALSSQSCFHKFTPSPYACFHLFILHCTSYHLNCTYQPKEHILKFRSERTTVNGLSGRPTISTSTLSFFTNLSLQFKLSVSDRNYV